MPPLAGSPEYSSDYGAIPHLYALLNDCFSFISESNEDITQTHLASLPTVLIGFSKGCVVLNQLLHELGQYIEPKDDDARDSVNANRSKYSIVTILCLYSMNALIWYVR